MRSPDDHLKRWLHPIVFGLWTCSLVYLLVTQRYTTFLRPEFGLLLVIALFVSVGFMIASMPGKRNLSIDFSGVVRALVLLLPILYLMTMPDATLGTNSFKNRFLGPASMVTDRPAGSDLPILGLEKPPGPSLNKEEGGTQERLPETTLLELLTNPARYQGQRVSVTGMIFHDEKLKLHFGEMNAVIYRFLMSCCAADALPLAIAVESDHVSEFENEQWVRIEGTFELIKIQQNPVPVLKKVSITATAVPKMPYLF
jgi:putative membrane protein